MLFDANGLYCISGLLRLNLVIIYGNAPKSRAKFKLLWLKLLYRLKVVWWIKICFIDWSYHIAIRVISELKINISWDKLEKIDKC